MYDLWIETLSSANGLSPFAGLLFIQGDVMKRVLCIAVLSLVIAASLVPASALADSRGHHAAMKLCKQRYKDAIRGIKRLKSHQRKARIEQARREREECENLAPR